MGLVKICLFLAVMISVVGRAYPAAGDLDEACTGADACKDATKHVCDTSDTKCKVKADGIQTNCSGDVANCPANAVCAAAGTCSCSTGYTVASGLCTAVIGSSCANDAACTTLLANTACTSKACACASGYTGSNCTAVIGSSCANDAACTTLLANTACTSSACACASGYTGSTCTVEGNAGVKMTTNGIALCLSILLLSYFF